MQQRDRGFTLIELMIVVLIIAVLIAIAVPAFLGFRERAQDRSAQSVLRDARVAEVGFFVDNEVFADAAELVAFEPSFEVTGDPDTGLAVTRVANAAADRYCVEMRSESGTYFGILERERPVKDLWYATAAVPVWGGGPCGWVPGGPNLSWSRDPW